MGIYGGLKPEDWQRWGQFTTFKQNAPDLLRRELRPEEVIYCSPLTDPYQPAEADARLMPTILEAVAQRPPRVFVIQTRGPLILRDVAALRDLARRTLLRVSFSITTNREDVRRALEPHCATFEERLETVRALRKAGINVYATLAPLLPSDLETLVTACIKTTANDLVGDPLHVRAVKQRGATTREAARRIAEKRDWNEWFDPEFQAGLIRQIQAIAARFGRRFETGPAGFGWLARIDS
jgi:DNA repair photolyase